MGQHGSVSTELRLRADDLKHLVRPRHVKGLTRADVGYARPLVGAEPLAGQEVLAVVGRFRHYIQGSGALLSDHWQALTYDLAALHGTSTAARASATGSGSGRGTDASFELRSITTHGLDRFLDRPDASGNDATWHTLVLGPGELVRGVDLAWSDRHALVGLRVRTNQRQSQWFGHRRGAVVKSVTAPHGYFVNAIERLGGDHNALGLRLCPIPELVPAQSLTDATNGGILVHDAPPRVGSPGTRDGAQVAFAAAHTTVRALVVACTASSGDAGIAELHVLSPAMFARHLAAREEPLPPHEHVFFLRHGEFVTAVDVQLRRENDKETEQSIAALRFHTNLTKSPWYGARDAERASEISVHTFKAPTEPRALQVCGFHGSFGATRLGALGVFYNATPLSPAAGTAPRDSALAKPKRLE